MYVLLLDIFSFYNFIIHKFQLFCKFSREERRGRNFHGLILKKLLRGTRFKKLISWYFVSRDREFGFGHFAQFSKHTPVPFVHISQRCEKSKKYQKNFKKPIDKARLMVYNDGTVKREGKHRHDTAQAVERANQAKLNTFIHRKGKNYVLHL